MSRHLSARGDVVTGTHRRARAAGTVSLDVADHAATRNLIEQAAAEAVFFAAGSTHVDGCEADPALAFVTNRDAPAAAARAARTRAAFVFYSTEYVFDGVAGPYAEADPVRPLSVYGRSKQEGEAAVLDANPDALVIRTTVVYGVDPQAKNFVYQVLRAARSGARMKVPADQRSSPTYVEDLADASLALVDKRVSGIFHVAGPDVVDRYAFARTICEVFGLDPGFVEAVGTDSLGQTAPRPLNAGLRVDRVAGLGIALRRPADGLVAMHAALGGHGG